MPHGCSGDGNAWSARRGSGRARRRGTARSPPRCERLPADPDDGTVEPDAAADVREQRPVGVALDARSPRRRGSRGTRRKRSSASRAHRGRLPPTTSTTAASAPSRGAAGGRTACARRRDATAPAASQSPTTAVIAPESTTPRVPLASAAAKTSDARRGRRRRATIPAQRARSTASRERGEVVDADERRLPPPALPFELEDEAEELEQRDPRRRGDAPEHERAERGRGPRAGGRAAAASPGAGAYPANFATLTRWS